MKIDPIILRGLLSTVLLCAAASHAAELDSSATPSAAPAANTLIYRQVTADGRIVYSDKATAGKVDHTITVPPPIKGNLWTTEPRERPFEAPRAAPTPIRKAAAPLPPPRPVFNAPQPYSDAALAEVMRAEMLLEDAKRRQNAGRAPRASELQEQDGITAPSTATYRARQQMLAREVDYAEQALQKARAARHATR